jgi:adenylosuccinate lyase
MTHPAAQSTTACTHQRGHIVDSSFFGDRYSTPASRRIFCDTCRVQRWLTVEAQLALAEAELGMIPDQAAKAIAEAAVVDRVDLVEVKAETDRAGHSLVGLLRVLQRACVDDAGQYIHYGATTQDIQDTAQSLEMRDVLDALDTTLREIVAHLLRLVESTSGTIALGRTHAQPALPITFGLKVAGWLDEMLRHFDRLIETRRHVVVVQLFGGAGTMAAFGPDAIGLLERFAERLGLSVPAIGWHTSRDRVAEFVSTLAMIAGTLGRAADEIRILSRPEFGEVSEAWTYGKVGSSTMPHKRNPERCEQVVALARLASYQVLPALAAMTGDHERDSRSLRLEWACVADVAHYTLSAAEIFTGIVGGLQVHPGRLRANVEAVAEQIASEPLMLALSSRLGKQAAHEQVYELTQVACDKAVSVRDLLSDRPDLGLEAAEVAAIFDPSSYLGASEILTARVATAARALLGS